MLKMMTEKTTVNPKTTVFHIDKTTNKQETKVQNISVK